VENDFILETLTTHSQNYHHGDTLGITGVAGKPVTGMLNGHEHECWFESNHQCINLDITGK